MSLEHRVAELLDALPAATGRRAMVTGANSGLGLETARQLAVKGAEVIMTSRDLAKGEAAREQVLADVPTAVVSVERLDLASLASVSQFAERVAADGRGVDLLIANAGIMALPRALTRDGFEAQFGVNHLGHFALTGLLLPALGQRPAARVVVTTSTAAFYGRIDFDDLMAERSYDRWRAYGQAKIANLLFARGLARRLKDAGSDISAHTAHPGLVYTNLQRAVVGSGQPSLPERIFLQGITPTVGQGPQMGALPQTYAALSPLATSGDFWAPRILHTRGRPVQVKGPASGFDEGLQDRLWEVSERLTGVEFQLRG